MATGLYYMDEIITDKNLLMVKSRPVTIEEIEALNLKERLKSAASKAWTVGLGLAAVQIGEPVCFAWYKWANEDHYLINPKIVEYIGKWKMLTEGCLSIPHKNTLVKRAYKIKYISDGKLFTAKGQRAQIIQHEIGHMNGKLIGYKGE